MSVMRAFATLLLGAAACGPEVRPELEDASWVVGRYAAGEGCTEKTVDISTGEPYPRGRIVNCTTNRFLTVEFFPDGRVHSEYFACVVDDTPAYDAESRWRATEEDGVVIVEPEEGQSDIFWHGGAAMQSASVRRMDDDCFQIYFEGPGTGQPPFGILHRGEFEWVQVPELGCEGDTRPTIVPQCPYDEDE